MDAKKSVGKNGLENAELLAAQLYYIKNNILRAIFKNPNSWPFHKPVDVVQLDLPDYYSIIKKPMDLGTIQQKIDRQQYRSAQECIDDFRLMCSNCYLYNGPKDEVVLMCREIEDMFDKKIGKIPKELNHVKREKGRTSLTVPSPGSAVTPISNGGIASNSSVNSHLHVKKEPKVVLSSFAPTTPKFSNAADHSRLTSNASSMAAVAAVTKTSARDVSGTFETHPFVGGTSIAPASKTKKTVKRKAEDNYSTHTVLETPRNVASQPVADANKRQESSDRSIKRARREMAEDQPQNTAGFGFKKLHTEALTYCHGILLHLFQKPLSTAASHFYNCADARNPEMKNYFDIIKRPMSLMTVKKNLENGVYQRSSDFAKDMRQIFTNCYRFYSPEEDIVRAAKTVQDFFELNFAKVPDDPHELVSPAFSTAVSNCDPIFSQTKMNSSDFDGSSSESSCGEDKYDSEEEKRETKLKLLQDQLLQVQKEVLRLSQHIQKGKKKKKSKKLQDKNAEVSVRVPEQPLVTKVVEPAVRTQTKPTKPTHTKLQSQKKATVAKAEMKTPVTTTPVNIPESPLPPPLSQASVHLSHEEQNQLREDIDRLPEDAQYRILQIIRDDGTPLNVSGDEIVIDFDTLKPSTIIEMRTFVAQISKDNADKKFESKRHSEDLVDVLADDEQRKPGAFDNSPVHSTGHSLPQQPMRPSTNANPKPPSRMPSVPSASSSSGSQVRQPIPELTDAIPPAVVATTAAAAESKQIAVNHKKSKSPPVISQESAFPKYSSLVDHKARPSSDRRLDDPPVSMRSNSVPSFPVKSSSTLDKPPSPATFPAIANKKPSSKSLVNSGEDSSSPKATAKLMSSSVSVKPGPPAVGSFGADMSKGASQKESMSKSNVTGWSFAGLTANTHQSSTPKPVSQQQTNALQFNRFKQIAAERQKRERINQEKEALRQQKMKVEEEERERRRKEERKVRDDDSSSSSSSSAAASNSSEFRASLPKSPPGVAESKAKENRPSQQQLKEQERLRAQQRRRMEAQSNKIDMNFQSDLLASFESNYRLNSTL